MKFKQGEIVENRYKIVKLINEGGMSYIYLALDLKLHNRYVVLKVLKHTFYANKTLLQQEAATLIELSHPHLPKIYDYFTLNEQCDVIVMEYVEGVVLSDIAKQLNDLSKLNVLIQIAEALCYLHQGPMHIIHQDIKPSNIMIDAQLNVKIIDFGISVQSVMPSSMIKHELNMPSFGTPDYMAPELLKGERASVQSDIYSFALVILFLFSIKRPSREEAEHIEHFLFLQIKENAITTRLGELLLWMLQPSPVHRLSDLKQAVTKLQSMKYELLNTSEPLLPNQDIVKKPLVIAILNLNRSAGATTIAMCLAQLLIERKKQVCLIEVANSQSNLEMSYLRSDMKEELAESIYCEVSKQHSTFYFISSKQLNDGTYQANAFNPYQLACRKKADVVIYDLSSMEDRFNYIKQLQSINHLIVVSSSDVYITNENELVNAIKYLQGFKQSITHIDNKQLTDEPQSLLASYVSLYQYVQIPFTLHKHVIEEQKRGKWLHPKSKLNVALRAHMKEIRVLQ